MLITLIIVLAIIYSGRCGIIQSFYVTNGVVPTKGHAFQFTCQISGNIDQIVKITLADPVTKGETDKCNCFGAACIKYNDNGHSCDINGTTKTLFVDIQQAKTTDDGVWICLTNDNGTLSRKSLNITVYTVPSTISFDGMFQQPQFLWNSNVVMACKTDQCTYKDPVFTWHYYKADGTSSMYTSLNAVLSNSSSGCVKPEMIYRSTLSLPLYSTAPGNADLSTKFKCQLTFSGTNFSKFTGETPDVSFAVQVQSVTINQGSHRLTNGQHVQVDQNVPTTFTCITGTSKPASTINWFIGFAKHIQTGSTFTYTPVNADHDSSIYCAAYNIQPESRAIQSQKPKLFVRVPVSTVTLRQGNTEPIKFVTVKEGETATFMCDTGVSRPTPTIDWYIGSMKRQSSTNKTYILNVVNADSDQEIYCKAYNLQPEASGVISAKPKLFIKVQVTSVNLKQGKNHIANNLMVTSGMPVTLTCEPSISRPAPTILWFIGKTLKQSSISPKYSLTATNDDHGMVIYCKAYNQQSASQAVTSSTPKLYVRVQVTSVTLKRGPILIVKNLTATAGTFLTLTCEPGISRPAPTILWYIGDTLKQSSNSIQYRLNAVNDDHGEVIYCKAYNLQSASQAVTSTTPRLYVRVEAAAPQIINGSMTSLIVMENENYTIQCRSSNTRPAAVMSWKLGTSVISDISFGEHSTANNLVYVVSIFLFTPRRQHNGSQLICESHIHGQRHSTITRKTIIVWWRPSVPAIQTVAHDFPWFEGQRGELECTTPNAGNPASLVTWIDDSGKIPNQQHYIIGNLSFFEHRRSVKCQLENEFTREKNERVESHVITLNVQFSPKIFTPDIVLAGKPQENMTSQVTFYENPNYHSIILLKNETQLLIETSQQTTSEKYLIVTRNVELNQSFTGAASLINGSRLDFTIQDLEDADFTTYRIMIRNVIGEATISVTIRATSSPIAPTKFRLIEQTHGILIFAWEKSFNGGYPQTFKIEVKEARAETWSTKRTVDESDSNSKLSNGSYIANVTDLQSGEYSFRLFAENALGPSGIVMFTATIKIPSEANKDSVDFVDTGNIRAAVGGAVGGLLTVVTVTLVGVLVLRRRKTFAGIKNRPKSDRKTRHTSLQNTVGSSETSPQPQSSHERDGSAQYESLESMNGLSGPYATLDAVSTNSSQRPGGDSYDFLDSAPDHAHMYTTLQVDLKDTTSDPVVYSNLKLTAE